MYFRSATVLGICQATEMAMLHMAINPVAIVNQLRTERFDAVATEDQFKLFCGIAKESIMAYGETICKSEHILK